MFKKWLKTWISIYFSGWVVSGDGSSTEVFGWVVSGDGSCTEVPVSLQPTILPEPKRGSVPASGSTAPTHPALTSGWANHLPATTLQSPNQRPVEPVLKHFPASVDQRNRSTAYQPPATQQPPRYWMEQ